MSIRRGGSWLLNMTGMSAHTAKARRAGMRMMNGSIAIGVKDKAAGE